MAATVIDVFSEGKTEQGALQELAKRLLPDRRLEVRNDVGEDRMLQQLRLRLKDWFELEASTGAHLRILVLRDWDRHRGKTLDGLCDSIADMVKPYHRAAKLQALPAHGNVFVLEPEVPGLKLALHIATRLGQAQFIKSTIDDYILTIALQPATMKALLTDCRKEGWTVTPEQFAHKIQVELPELLKANGISQLLEAKDVVRLYAALLQMSASPAVFASKAVCHASAEELREIFAPVLSAVEYLATGDGVQNG